MPNDNFERMRILWEECRHQNSHRKLLLADLKTIGLGDDYLIKKRWHRVPIGPWTYRIFLVLSVAAGTTETRLLAS